MLNRFLAAKKDEQRAPKQKRPYLATECLDLHEADRWRQQIIKEIGRKVMDIQNAGLGEHRYAFDMALRYWGCPCGKLWARQQQLPICRLRDLNDEINKLIREKGHWEVRIVELGGPDYGKTAPKVTDSEGNDLQGATGRGAGYRYVSLQKVVSCSHQHMFDPACSRCPLPSRLC